MGHSTSWTIGIAAGVLAMGVSAQAITPEQKCEASKNDVAGRYVSCLAKVEKRFVYRGDLGRYALGVARCAALMESGWERSESIAANGESACPSQGDQLAVRDFLDACQQAVAEAVGGGTLPVDIATCNADLAMCVEDLGLCDAGLGTCDADLMTCDGSLTTCNGDLGTCNTNYGTCSGNLTTCSDDLGTCSGNLTTCSDDLGTCSGNLTTCSDDLGTCSGNLTTCSDDLATANVGTAVVGDVLTGKTFTSTAGLGATGTMPDNGGVTLTPTTSDQAIAAGYHDGTGVCEGDADLVAANIKSGVNLFGVAGTASAGGLQKTGQTTCYDGTWGWGIACAGTGQDGELQRGVARSFTDNGDGTITDNLTGLMWEKLSDDGSIHDKDNAYTWNNTFASKVATLNSTVFAGYSDWRVPNVVELQSLVNYGAVNPSAFSAFNTGCVAACTVLTCSCTQSAFYWSSTTYQGGNLLVCDPAVGPCNSWPGTSFAWSVPFGDVATPALYKLHGYYVRAVRAGS